MADRTSWEGNFEKELKEANVARNLRENNEKYSKNLEELHQSNSENDTIPTSQAL